MKLTNQPTLNKEASLDCVNGLNVVTVKERQGKPQRDGGSRRIFFTVDHEPGITGCRYKLDKGKRQILILYLPDRTALYQQFDFHPGRLSWISDTQDYAQ